MRVERDNLYLCSDCTMVACNGSDGADIHPDQLQRTETGLRALGPHVVPNFDSNAEQDSGIEELSSVPCDACRTHLAGYRARFATLAE